MSDNVFPVVKVKETEVICSTRASIVYAIELLKDAKNELFTGKKRK